jgi:hypothetical protein
MSAVTIILIIVGVLAIGCAGIVVGGVLWVKGKADQFVSEIGDGGLTFVLSTPAQVLADLKGPKKDYVGSWSNGRGGSIAIEEDGQVSYVKVDGGSKTSYTLPIAGFSGNDIICKALITVVINVSTPPRQVDGRWEMVVDGSTFHRE